MSDSIRVGLIGYGYASKTFHAPLIAGTPGMALAAVSSSDATKVHADWPTVPVVSEPKHLFNDPNIDLIDPHAERHPFPAGEGGAGSR